MSDQSGESPGSISPHVFTETELQRFYSAKWKLKHCEICEVSEWWTDRVRQLAAIPAGDPDGLAVTADAMTVHVRIICRSCGNTKFLLASIIRRWLAANP